LHENVAQLTRRANQGHIDIIANIVARAGRPAAGFFIAMVADSRFNLSKLFRCIVGALFTAR
jgi:hypothetical protein